VHESGYCTGGRKVLSGKHDRPADLTFTEYLVERLEAASASRRPPEARPPAGQPNGRRSATEKTQSADRLRGFRQGTTTSARTGSGSSTGQNRGSRNPQLETTATSDSLVNRRNREAARPTEADPTGSEQTVGRLLDRRVMRLARGRPFIRQGLRICCDLGRNQIPGVAGRGRRRQPGTGPARRPGTPTRQSWMETYACPGIDGTKATAQRAQGRRQGPRSSL